MAWGSAHGWDEPSFRVYYLAGALLSAPLLGIGSLQLWRPALGRAARARSTPGSRSASRSAMPLHGTFDGDRRARAHRTTSTSCRASLAIAASSLGALAVVVVAAATLRRRPRGERALLVGAVAAAAAASALTQTAVAAAAACFALAAVPARCRELEHAARSAPRPRTRR